MQILVIQKQTKHSCVSNSKRQLHFLSTIPQNNYILILFIPDIIRYSLNSNYQRSQLYVNGISFNMKRFEF